MISIILPCFNVESYLDRCFASCLAQTYQDFEIIFVDDASTDSTLNKLKEIQGQDSRVKLIALDDNVGTFHARKIGYEASGGDYIFFLDPDDEIAPDFLYAMLRSMTLNSADMIFCRLDIRPKKKYSVDIPVPNDCAGEDIFNNCILDMDIIPKGNPGKFYKRSLVAKIYKDLSFIKNKFIYAEDVVFFFSALLNSGKISSIKNDLYIYHENPSSITKTRNLAKINNNIDQINMAIDLLKILETGRSLIAKKAAAILCESLIFDKKYLERIKYVVEGNNTGYLLKTIEIIRIKFQFKNIFRLFAFLFSFGFLKL